MNLRLKFIKLEFLSLHYLFGTFFVFFGVIFFSTSLLLAVLSSVDDSDSIVNDLNEVEIIDQIEDIDLSDLPDLN